MSLPYSRHPQPLQSKKPLEDEFAAAREYVAPVRTSPPAPKWPLDEHEA